MQRSPDRDRLSLAVVFLISRRCNLECSYCNVEASPRLGTALGPREFEGWVRALAELGEVDLGLQLHGGEPLLLDPPVELLGSIARNALIPHPTSSLGSLGIVTNGTLLDTDRARSLVDAGIRVVLSVDGPQQVHDRHRVTLTGRGSHRQAMRGLAALRSVDPDPVIIAVISEPADVALAVQFFASEGLSRVKINPIRPEGRGATIRGDAGAAHMVALADAYFEAAVSLSAHNRHRPEQPLYEENIAVLVARVIAGETVVTAGADWTLLVDDRGRLWSHPGGYGVEHMALTRGEQPTADLLSRALGMEGKPRAARMMSRQRETFRACAGCVDPIWCAGFRPIVGGPSVSLDCVWRERLMSLLETWWQESPLDAIAVLPIDSRSASSPPEAAPFPVATEDVGLSPQESTAPPVRALLAGMRVGPDGRAYFADYADRAVRICGLDPFSQKDTFLQLATLARRYASQPDRLELAQSLARLARIGLEPLARYEPKAPERLRRRRFANPIGRSVETRATNPD